MAGSLAEDKEVAALYTSVSPGGGRIQNVVRRRGFNFVAFKTSVRVLIYFQSAGAFKVKVEGLGEVSANLSPTAPHAMVFLPQSPTLSISFNAMEILI